MGAGIWRQLVAGAFLLGLPGAAWAQVASLTFLHTPPARVVMGQPLRIVGNIIGADQVSIAALAYRTQGHEDFDVRELKLVKGDAYEGVIPGEAIAPPAVEYYCYAVDFEGNRHIVFASEQEPQRVPVLSPTSVEDRGDKGKTDGKKPGEGHKTPSAKTGDEAGDKGEKSAAPAVPVSPEIVTTALVTGSSQEVGRAPAMITVVGRQQIEDMGARTVADVLDQLPGLTVARAVSGEYRLAARGIQTGADVLVMLDGHRINDLYSGDAFLEFPAEAVERIELIRGPASLLYGSGALAGLIHIVTRRSPGLHFSAAYGLFNQTRLSAGGGYRADAFDIGGQMQFVYSQGQDRTVGQDILTGVVGSNPTAEDVSNTPGSVDDSRMQLHAQLHGSLKDLAGGQLDFISHYAFQQRGSLVGKFDSLDCGSKLQLHLVTADLRFGLPLSEVFALKTRAYVDAHLVDNSFKVIPDDENEEHNAYVAGGHELTDGMFESARYSAVSTGIEAGVSYDFLKSNTLLAGLVFEYQSLPDYQLERDIGSAESSVCASGDECTVPIQGFALPVGRFDGQPSGKDRMVLGLFAQDQWTDIVEGLDALAGFRLDYYVGSDVAFTPRMAISYAPLDGLRFKTLYAMAFRAPTFRELYEDSSFDPLRGFSGSDSLAPVTTHTLELAAEGRIQHAGVTYSLTGAFFMSWIRDSIVALDTGSGQPTFDNVQSVDVLGTEIEGLARFGRRSRIYVNSSWFRAEVDIVGQAQSSYITDVPQMRLNLGIDLGIWDYINLHFGVRHGSERRNNTRLPMEILRSFIIPSYTLIRAGVSSEPILFDHLVVFAHCYNLFDTDHRDPPPRPDYLTGYIPREPFSFIIGVAWRP
ncbi:MAG: TonB-dependent receptor [Deltaproteobacteria bacterium]|nr:TonB-dependent receptor [Deltaproteobacteria bacterium]